MAGLVVTGPVNLQANTTIKNSANVFFQGPVSGSGGLEKAMAGMLTLAGAQNNDFSGTTAVDAGTLLLSKSGGSTAVPNSLQISGGGTVRLTAPQQISAAAAVTLSSVGGTAELDLHGQTQTLTSLSFVPSGLVLLGSGALVDRSDPLAALQDDVRQMWIIDAAGSAPPPVFATAAGITVGHLLLPGDANADGRVNFADLLIFAQNYGKTGAAFSQGDFTGDGAVTFADMLIFTQNYGRSGARGTRKRS